VIKIPHSLLQLVCAALCLSGTTIPALLVGCKQPNRSPQGPLETPANISEADEAKLDIAAEADFWQTVDPNHSGVRFAYRNAEEVEQCTILESVGGGAGVLDFDADGRPDVCASGGGKFSDKNIIAGLPTGLLQNQGEWKFKDRSDTSRIAPAAFYTNGIAVGDFNNDGFSDVLITGYQGMLLWVNQGDGTFLQLAELLGIKHDLWGSSAAWGDLNGDGALDVYVADYVNWSFDNNPNCRANNGRRDICPPKSFESLPDKIYYSQTDGTFRESSQFAGLRQDGKGLGVLLADVNADSRLDIYVANDTTNNFLYLNKGAGKFEEVGELHGVALDDRGIPNGSMGVDLMDYNRDGQFDIWVCNYEDEYFALYRNDSAAHFMHVSKSAGLTSFGQRFVAFGTACADFDFDGDEDIVVSNGHVIKYPQRSARKQLPLYLENRNARFVKVIFSSASYFGSEHEGRGLATADFDSDGDLDLVISLLNEPVALIRNAFPPVASLSVKLIGTQSNRDAVGANLILHTKRGLQARQIKGGGSYLSTHELCVRWGIGGDEEVVKLEVIWPSGVKQTIRELTDGLNVLVEPQLNFVK